MAKRTPQYVRTALTEIFENRRQSDRCVIVKELSDEASALGKEYNDEIAELEKQRDVLWNRIGKLGKERDDLLTENLLHSQNFTKSEKGSCRWRPLHPRLEVFDKQTDHGVLEIMMRDEVSEGTLDELAGESDDT